MASVVLLVSLETNLKRDTKAKHTHTHTPHLVSNSHPYLDKPGTLQAARFGVPTVGALLFFFFLKKKITSTRTPKSRMPKVELGFASNVRSLASPRRHSKSRGNGCDFKEVSDLRGGLSLDKPRIRP